MRSLDDARRFLEEVTQQAEANHNIQAAIIVDGRLAGVASFHRIDWQNRATCIGYWLAEKYQGRGLVTASCHVLIDHAFAALNLHRLVISCAPGNTRSRAVAQRLGFAHEGRERDAEWLYDHFVDHDVFVQLQPDWEKLAIQRLAAFAQGSLT
jgi:ribosomal-protein-serine acetyltransferase